MEAAGQALAASKPETIVVYSTKWIAVLDELWQARPHLQGIHVDQNWHEYGDLPFDIRIDTALAGAAIEMANAGGIKSKAVDYDQFPIDTGTIVASNFLNAEKQYPLMIAANNVYHDWARTEELGRIAVQAAERLQRRIAVVGIGELSGAFFRHAIDITEDCVTSPDDDQWNRKMLELLEQGDMDAFFEAVPRYAEQAKVDMGFKHMAFIKGAMNGQLTGGKVHAYQPLYGAGAAVVEFPVQ